MPDEVRGSFLNCCLVCRGAGVVIPGEHTTASIYNAGIHERKQSRNKVTGLPLGYKVIMTSICVLYME